MKIKQKHKQIKTILLQKYAMKLKKKKVKWNQTFDELLSAYRIRLLLWLEFNTYVLLD